MKERDRKSEGEIEDGFEKNRTPYTVESFSGGPQFWRTYGLKLCSILQASCADFLSEEIITNQMARISKDLKDEETNAVLLRSVENGDVVGFTYLLPSEKDPVTMEKSIYEFGLPEEHMAIVGWTAILPDQRHKHGWTMLMDELDRQFEASGRYDGMYRLVRTADNYAEKVRHRYTDKIVYEEDVKSGFGHQKLFVLDCR